MASTHGDHTVKLVDVVRSLDELRAQVMVDSRGVESVPGMGNPAMLRVLRNNHLNSGGSGSSNAMMSDEALPPAAESSLTSLSSTSVGGGAAGGGAPRSCVITELRGHPRTPWTVKFHPTKEHLVASGCLGGQLRLWDVNERRAIHQAELPHPVISLSFHPDGNKLAAAAGYVS